MSGTILGIIGIAISFIGVIVGIIGCVSISKANRMKINTMVGSSVTQGENVTTYNYGTDTYLVVKIAREITQEELGKYISELENLKSTVNDMPKIYTSETEPTDAPNGSLWFQPVDTKKE